MRITDLRFETVFGETDTDLPLHEERLVQPIDVYPEHRVLGSPIQGEKRVALSYLLVETDQGITGRSAHLNKLTAFFIQTQLRDLLIGMDPLATELVWDKMYRKLIHGRKCEPMLAVSAVDCALWDVRGKAAGLPVHRLLGGPVRDSFPAYASMLGFSVEPAKAAARAKEYAEKGFTAQKWFFRHGPLEGEEGVRKNVALVAAIREAVGDEVDIMVDAWNSWDVRYSLDMARRIAPLRPRWLEEPVKPDDIPGYGRLRASSPIPIAGGEHEYTRWGTREYLEAGAIDVYQPDTCWAGGLSEMVKICAMASAYDVQVIPHGHSVPINAHLTAAMSPGVSPLIEYLVHHNEHSQHFLKHPVKPVTGIVTVGQEPGLGIDLDEEKILRREALTW